MVRVLGTRQLLQAAIIAAVPTRGAATAGAVVDALHAATDVATSVVSPGWRRLASADALITGAFAASGWSARRHPAP